MRLYVAVLLSIFITKTYPDLAHADTRDPRQLSIYVTDLDESFMHNVGGFRVKLAPQAGIAGLGTFSAMPKTVNVPVHDFEGNTGLRVKDLLGKFENGRFIGSAFVDTVELSDGTKFRPAYYYFDPADGYDDFRPNLVATPGQKASEYTPDGRPEDGFLYNALKQKLESNTPFLMEASAFLAPTFDEKFADRLTGVVLTKRGHAPAESALAFNLLRDKFGWGTREWASNAYVNLTHPDFFQFAENKDRYVDGLFRALGQRHMSDFSTPHFLVMFENDRHMLLSLENKMRNLANSGVFVNPVVPILVNLVEPEVFENPDGIDWNRSRAQSRRPNYRVKIFWPNNTEGTDNLARVFELTLGMSELDAKNFYAKQMNKYWCRDIVTGKVTVNAAAKGVRK